MGTEHLGDTTELTPDEIADRTIEFMEEIGPALLPWQATTLRAMLSYPVGTRFVVAAPRQHTPETKAPRGLVSDAMVLDELRKLNNTPMSPQPEPGMVREYRDGEWVWAHPCTCTFDNHGFDSGCKVHDTGTY